MLLVFLTPKKKKKPVAVLQYVCLACDTSTYVVVWCLTYDTSTYVAVCAPGL